MPNAVVIIMKKMWFVAHWLLDMVSQARNTYIHTDRHTYVISRYYGMFHHRSL